MIGCSCYGYLYGDPGKLFAPLDSDGNICGYDPAYFDYPYMYIWDIMDATSDVHKVFDSAVCVKKCPSEEAKGGFIIECKETDYLRNL